MLQESLFQCVFEPEHFCESFETYIHTYIHVWELKNTYTFAPYLGFQKYRPSQFKKIEQECSRRAFSSVFLNPKLFVKI